MNPIKFIKLIRAVRRCGMWLDDDGNIQIIRKDYKARLDRAHRAYDDGRYGLSRAILANLQYDVEHEDGDANAQNFILPEIVALNVAITLDEG